MCDCLLAIKGLTWAGVLIWEDTKGTSDIIIASSVLLGIGGWQDVLPLPLEEVLHEGCSKQRVGLGLHLE